MLRVIQGEISGGKRTERKCNISTKDSYSIVGEKRERMVEREKLFETLLVKDQKDLSAEKKKR